MDDHPTIIADDDLHPTVSDRLAESRCRWQLGIRQNHRRHQIRKFTATKTPFAKIPPPGKQQGGRNPMPACCRRHLPMPLMALLDDPKLLRKAPSTPTPTVYHFQSANLRTIRMPSHKDSQQQIMRKQQAVYAG